MKSLTLITNQTLATGIFHDKLKIAKVKKFFVKGDNTQFGNYRTISLLPVISKVIEKIIYTQLDIFLKAQNLLFDNQYGFRTKHSTGFRTKHSTGFDALELTDRIIAEMDKHEILINIYLDLYKAFDTLDHMILLKSIILWCKGSSFNFT